MIKPEQVKIFDEEKYNCNCNESWRCAGCEVQSARPTIDEEVADALNKAEKDIKKNFYQYGAYDKSIGKQVIEIYRKHFLKKEGKEE